MIKKSCYFDLIYQSLLTVLLRISSLFSKGFNCHLFLILKLSPQVDSRKISFTKSFLCFEQLVEVELIHKLSKLYLPFLNLFSILVIKLFRLIPFAHKLYPIWHPKLFLFTCNFSSQYLINCLESNVKSLPGLSIVRQVKKNNFGCEH